MGTPLCFCLTGWNWLIFLGGMVIGSVMANLLIPYLPGLRRKP